MRDSNQTELKRSAGLNMVSELSPREQADARMEENTLACSPLISDEVLPCGGRRRYELAE